MSEDEKKGVRLLDRSGNQSEPVLKPIVLKFKKSKKNDKSPVVEDDREEKYSKGLKYIQQLDGNIVHIAQKATKALSKGVDVYEKERQKSAKEKTDGAIEDFINNAAKAGSAYIKEAADIPVDLAEAISPVAYRKKMHKNLLRASKFIRLWRI
jgi:hypothetical protein